MSRYEICADPARRHDFLLLFDVTDGNPNGDPDAGNMPRIDPETAHGLVTDVCIKRKVRNFITLARAGKPGYDIYVNDKGVALNTLHEQAYKNEGVPESTSDMNGELTSTGKKQGRDVIDIARSRMCRRFYDVRVFGAVMSTGKNAGQVRGPMQLTFARSIDPIASLEVAITRVAITKPEDMVVAVNEQGEGSGGKRTEMGRKAILPYGLYVAKGFYSPSFAEQTGVNRDDLELFWSALERMWDLDHSASRGMMSCRGLYVFSHEDRLGNAPAHRLFGHLDVRRRDGIDTPRRFEDYVVTAPSQPGVDDEAQGKVVLTTLVEG